jgi:hypothetical protein
MMMDRTTNGIGKTTTRTVDGKMKGLGCQQG